ncbi:uncharacterized protein L3040_005259 [Drepanopeziza brunnea f. sp. 'multigermtubi']|uniref:uncharacterized protein n=1 Tax=Drepanopeziza brunnea f. sp. 'multigermtubi' TaxID=698441 RepID=UPI00239D9F36|nr:hypothetical protein L3040_005259 [Drepanopeziza brunnea f. sp. 'multigermtubi']
MEGLRAAGFACYPPDVNKYNNNNNNIPPIHELSLKFLKVSLEYPHAARGKVSIYIQALPSEPLTINNSLQGSSQPVDKPAITLEKTNIPPPPKNMPGFWTIGCLYGASAVTLGAFGAHGLKKRIADPQRIANWSTAAQYQLVHSGILLVGTVAAPQNKLAASLLVAGMTMFSGSIYLLTLDPQRFKFLGPVTPLGGLCLIGGWAALAFGRRIPFPSLCSGILSELRL